MRQISTPRAEYVEKILRDGEGRLVRATFYVYEKDGRIKARLISAIPVEEKEILAIATCIQTSNSIQISITSPVVSPYVVLNLLYTSGSKPRAPTI